MLYKVLVCIKFLIKSTFCNLYLIIENKDLLEDFEKLKDLAKSVTTFDTDKKKLQNSIKLENSANLK